MKYFLSLLKILMSATGEEMTATTYALIKLVLIIVHAEMGIIFT